MWAAPKVFNCFKNLSGCNHTEGQTVTPGTTTQTGRIETELRNIIDNKFRRS